MTHLPSAIVVSLLVASLPLMAGAAHVWNRWNRLRRCER